MSKFQTFWNLSSDSSNPGILNMYVYGKITSQSNWLSGSDSDVVTSDFIKDLQNHPGTERINVYINSPGGDVFAAAAIKNQLKTHPAEVHSYIDGLSASAAVGLSMGADVIHMSRSALLMIHNPSTKIGGEVKDFEKGIEILQKVKSTIVAIYMEKTNLSQDKIVELMDNETWLSADEALSMGFIDEIIEDQGLKIANTGADKMLVNGVLFNLQDTLPMQVGNYTFCNNLSVEKLQSKLAEVNNKQGGTRVMNFEEILDAMPEEQKDVLNTHLVETIAAAVSEKETVWATEKDGLVNQVAELEAKLTEAQNAVVPVAEDPEEAILNSLPEEARTMVMNARQQAADAEAKLATAANEKKMADFRNRLSVYDALPIEEKHVQALFQLATTDDSMFEQVEGLLKVANSAMSAGFVAVGSDQGTPVFDDAAGEIMNSVAKLQAENSALDFNAALKTIASTNPTLYQRYRSETT